MQLRQLQALFLCPPLGTGISLVARDCWRTDQAAAIKGQKK